jgi:oligoendopeptidase F
MNLNCTGGIMLLNFLMATAAEPSGKTVERRDLPVPLTWNLTDLYASDAEWIRARDSLVAGFDRIDAFKGRTTESAGTLLEALDLVSSVNREFASLSGYAGMASDEDTRIPDRMARRQELSQIGTNWQSRLAFLEPELVRLTPERVEALMSEKPRLAEYRMTLMDLIRRKVHMLSEPEERIVAEAGLVTDGPYSIYRIFANADFPYPSVTLGNGETVKLDQSGYAKYRQAPDRDDRERVFAAFWEAMRKFEGTFGVQLYSNIKKDLFYARARGYASCLESALDGPNVPVDVYHSLIRNVNDALPTFHRYLLLKKRMLGVDTLKYSDLYAPVVRSVDMEFPYEKAREAVLESLKPMGKDYVASVRKAFDGRWIDVLPTPGKRSGAYSNGSAYDVHPYILLNYNGRYQDASTLAHELGHAMHSALSNRTQPFPTADYPIFVAEVASTFNEALLNRSMLAKIRDDDTRLSLLMEILDNIKGTVFRQTQFAEFELSIHQAVERGEALTGESLTRMYGDLLRKYYGHDGGCCRIDDAVCVEWAYIPHFYYNYYVYQYATSFTASVALSEKVLAGEKGALERVLEFLSSGGKDYPIDLLRRAGVDMTTPAPFRLTMEAMNRTMDEIEKILDRKAAGLR